MGTHPLTSIMNDLVRTGVNAVVFECAPAARVTELDAFMQLDDTLASLNRDYINARRHHQEARAEHGADSPMADMAADMEDSAWCAMQTRLMELRAQGDLMRRVQVMILHAEQEQTQKIKEREDLKSLDLFYRMQTMRTVKEKNKPSAIYEWLIVLMLFERWAKLPFPTYTMPMQQAA